ncbi:MAG: efflux RND transporter periplasmic adaptor subunit, partial [Saprospiraceae bacterium]|nr:efflux RND transporter periplasmic adaptor subunit [Saprospiraceae bacterium]
MRYSTIVFIASLLLSACKKEPEKTQPVMERITESVYASGIIKSKNQNQDFSTVGGLIQQILVKEGDVFK